MICKYFYFVDFKKADQLFLCIFQASISCSYYYFFCFASHTFMKAFELLLQILEVKSCLQTRFVHRFPLMSTYSKFFKFISFNIFCLICTISNLKRIFYSTPLIYAASFHCFFFRLLL